MRRFGGSLSIAVIAMASCDGAPPYPAKPAAVVSLQERRLAVAPARGDIEDYRFSPDGEEVIYWLRRGNRRTVCVGTTVGEEFDMERYLNGNLLSLRYVISPDGKHIAYIAEERAQRFVVFDGTSEPPSAPKATPWLTSGWREKECSNSGDSWWRETGRGNRSRTFPE